MPCMKKNQAVIPGNPKKPTERQAEFLNAFRRVTKRNGGVSPSLAELAKEMGVNVPTAQGYVRRLLASGVLVRRAGCYRSLQIAAKK